ncbi:MAG: hypothetical protein LC799_27475 [Actinobacteria bacterium]|nr:hypothetical protein [Actinomycetota bacterium]
MAGEESFDVEPQDVKKAGAAATEIGERVLRERDDLLEQAGSVSGGLEGFTLTGAHSAIPGVRTVRTGR